MKDDDTTTTSSRPKTMKRTINDNNTNKKRSKAKTESTVDDDDVDDDKAEAEEEKDCGDVEVWDTLSRSFRQVQTVLDKNRELIGVANENHQSRNADNIAGNVSLIREINGNISKVIEMYSDLSVNFAGMVSQRRPRNTPTPTTTNTSGDVERSDS